MQKIKTSSEQSVHCKVSYERAGTNLSSAFPKLNDCSKESILHLAQKTPAIFKA